MVNNYKESLLKYAYQLDLATNSKGIIIDYTNEIVNHSNYQNTKKLFSLLSNFIKTEDSDIIQKSKNYNDHLLKFIGTEKIYENLNNSSYFKENDIEYTLSELIDQLNKLVGLKNIKSKINDLVSFQKIQQLRKQHNLINPKSTMHLAFIGNPGTGKTTVARIVGRIYKQIGLLSQGHFIEVSRTDLIAGYQGQTALKVKEVIERAKGGVLFIDEAYSITENDHSDSYGKECITELTKALEDHRENLVVIVAGYTEPMNKFFSSNPGLKSRFNTFLEFEDYSNSELIEILINLFQDSDYIITNDICNYIKAELNTKNIDSTTNKANGRFIRNIYDDIIIKHANRVSIIENPTIDDLKIIKKEDIYIY